MVTDPLQPTSDAIEEQPIRLNDWAEPAAWVLAVLMIGAGVYLLLVPPSGPHQSEGVFHYIFAVGWIAFGLMMASIARAGIMIQSGGVKVRGILRTAEFEWQEIENFKLRRSIYRPGLRIVLKDGQEEFASGLTARNRDEWRRAEAIVAQLNSRLGNLDSQRT